MPAAPAAAYPSAFCASYAAIVHKLNKATSARERVKIITNGKVRRHVDRGETRESKRERREDEDDQSWAGARNAAEVITRWPKYQQVMAPVRDELIMIANATPGLQGQRVAGGAKLSRSPPAPSTWKAVRKQFGLSLVIPRRSGGLCPASPRVVFCP